MNIETQVRLLLPSPLADRIVDNWAAVPVRHDKRPACSWADGVDPSTRFTADGLGMMTGEPSGIMVLDLDSHKIPLPFEPNVRTQRGHHVWFEADGRGNRVDCLKAVGIQGVDLRGAGGYAIFHGSGKTLLHSQVLPASSLDLWFSQHSSLEESKRMKLTDGLEGLSEGIEYRTAYLEWVKLQGFTIDTDRVMKTYMSQMRSRTEGSRNDTLFRLTIEVCRIGGDVESLALAALDSGLEPSEIRSTMDSAITALDLDPRPEETVMARVLAWQQSHGMRNGVLDWVAVEAVRQNSLRPLISQSQCAEAIGRTQRGVGKALDIYESKYKIIKKHPNEGVWNGHFRHCNNYELIMSPGD